MKPWIVVQLGEILNGRKNTLVSEHDTEQEANEAAQKESEKLNGLDIMGHCPIWVVVDTKTKKR